MTKNRILTALAKIRLRGLQVFNLHLRSPSSLARSAPLLVHVITRTIPPYQTIFRPRNMLVFLQKTKQGRESIAKELNMNSTSRVNMRMHT